MVRILERRKATANILALFAVGTFGLHVFTLLLLITQGMTIRALVTQEDPNFVQLIDGQPASVTNDLERDPQAIRQFVAETMTSMFNWSGKIPAQTVEEVTKPTPDPGITIGTGQGSKRVTTSSWVASFALSEDFRQSFLSTIADMTPSEVFRENSNQKITAELVIKRMYPPENIAPGKWRIGMVADIVQRTDEDRKLIVPFNKDFIVRAVDTFVHPLSDSNTVLQQAVYNVRAAEMEIEEIRNLCLLDGYGSPNGENNIYCENVGSSGNFIR
jgi:hypothetical protein